MEFSNQIESKRDAYARKIFLQATRKLGTNFLDKKSFVEVLRKLKSKQPIKSRDLDDAFELADVDKNGVVDEIEFINLYSLIEEGKLQGLTKNPWKFKTKKEEKKLSAKREMFRNSLQKQRKENRMSSTSLSSTPATSRSNSLQKPRKENRMSSTSLSSITTTSLSNSFEYLDARKQLAVRVLSEKKSDAEATIVHQERGRFLTARALLDAKNKWEGRKDKVTIPDNIGGFGNNIEANKYRYEEVTINNTSALEIEARNQLHGRKQASLMLSNAKDEWEDRDKITIVHDIGSLGNETEAGKHRRDEITEDNTGSAELHIRNQLHGRKQASLMLSNAKYEWEDRDKITIVHDIGSLGHETEAGKHRRDEITVENTGSAELINRNRQQARSSMSQDLSKNSEEWKARNKKKLLSSLERFEAIDTDHDGIISLEELRVAAPSLNIKDEDVEDIFIAMDTNGSGDISMEEFLTYFGNRTKTKGFANASAHTETSLRNSDKKSQFVTAKEIDQKSLKETRAFLSSAGTSANLEWKKRQEKKLKNLSLTSYNKRVNNGRRSSNSMPRLSRKDSNSSSDSKGSLRSPSPVVVHKRQSQSMERGRTSLRSQSPANNRRSHRSESPSKQKSLSTNAKSRHHPQASLTSSPLRSTKKTNSNIMKSNNNQIKTSRPVIRSRTAPKNPISSSEVDDSAGLSPILIPPKKNETIGGSAASKLPPPPPPPPPPPQEQQSLETSSASSQLVEARRKILEFREREASLKLNKNNIKGESSHNSTLVSPGKSIDIDSVSDLSMGGVSDFLNTKSTVDTQGNSCLPRERIRTAYIS